MPSCPCQPVHFNLSPTTLLLSTLRLSCCPLKLLVFHLQERRHHCVPGCPCQPDDYSHLCFSTPHSAPCNCWSFSYRSGGITVCLAVRVNLTSAGRCDIAASSCCSMSATELELSIGKARELAVGSILPQQASCHCKRAARACGSVLCLC